MSLKEKIDREKFSKIYYLLRKNVYSKKVKGYASVGSIFLFDIEGCYVMTRNDIFGKEKKNNGNIFGNF